MERLRTLDSWYTTFESLEQNCRPSSESMVRGHPLKGMDFVDQDIGRTLSGKLSGSDGEHVGLTTETIGDQQDVGIASRRDRKRAKIVDTDGDTRTFQERHGDDWPIGQSAAGFSELGASSSGEATTGCKHSCRSTSKTAPACAMCAWCQGGKKPSNGKLA